MFAYMLQGALAGRNVFVADTDAAKGVTDGWLYDTTGKPYPWDVPATKSIFVPIPASMTAWINAGSPAKDPPNQAPTNITLTPSTVVNTAAIGTQVGTLSATDPDETGTPVFEKVGTQPKYAIVGNKVNVAAALAAGTDTLTVKVTDSRGGTYQKALSIVVT